MSQQPPTTRTLDLRWAHEVVSRPVEWLWQPWLARGTIAVLDGDPGVGKSSLAFDLAARVSTGRPFPGETEPRTPAVALVVAMEDPLDTVVKPRLENAGADMTRVALLGGIRESGPDGETESVLQLPRDLDLIAAACELHRPALMVIDPLFAALGYDQRGRFIKANGDQGVRKLTGRLKLLAERLGLTIWLTRHLNKGAGGNALKRGSGSIAIAGQARSVMLAAGHPDDPSLRVFAMTKSNLAAKPRSWQFRLAGKGPSSVVEWDGPCDLTADDLVQPLVQENQRRDALLVATDFLEEVMDGKPRSWDELVALAAGQKIAEMTLRRARRQIGLVKKRLGKNGVVWELPFRLPPL